MHMYMYILADMYPRTHACAPHYTQELAADMQSSLAGLTIQQMCDLDVEQLAVKIDKHHAQTKKSILVRTLGYLRLACTYPDMLRKGRSG